MTTEDQLRRALKAEAERVTPADRWDEVAAAATAAEQRRRRQRTWLAVATSAAVVALVVGAVAVLTGDADDRQRLDTGPAATTTATAGETTTPTTQTEQTTPTTAVPIPPVDAVWPPTAMPFDDAVDAAESFMRDYLGMADAAGEELVSSAETTVVEVRRAGGRGRAATNVTVFRRGDHFWISTAQSPQIRLDGPEAMSDITSPVHVEGAASAFEGNVIVEVRQGAQVLGSGFVTGSGSAELGPFAGDIQFRQPGGGRGALVLSVSSGEDGGLEEATVIPINFAGVGATTGDSCTPPPPAGEGRTIEIVLSCEEQSLVAVRRRVGDTPGVLRAALEQLLAGPTPEEEAVGLSSWFSDATAGMLRDVTVTGDGTAVVVLDSALPETIPNASTSAGSAALLGQLNGTVFQFENVQAIEYRLDGSCEAFWSWLQGSCHLVERTD